MFDLLSVSGVDVPFVLTNGNRQVGQSIEPITLYLTVVVSPPNTTSNPVLAVDANVQSTEVNVSSARETSSTTAQESTNTARSTVTTDTETLPPESPPSVPLPDTAMPLAAGNLRAEVPLVESALHGAQEAMTTMSNLSNTWEDALERIKWVMDAVSSVAEVRFLG